MVGYPCSQLIAMHKAEDLQEIPAEIFAVEGQKNVFQIHFSQSGETTNFILDQVFDKNKFHPPSATLLESSSGKTLLLNTFYQPSIPFTIGNLIKYL